MSQKDKAFEAHQIHVDTGEATGTVETFVAGSHQAAVAALLYMRQLGDGRAHLGPTKAVVYSQGFAWVVVRGEAKAS